MAITIANRVRADNDWDNIPLIIKKFKDPVDMLTETENAKAEILKLYNKNFKASGVTNLKNMVRTNDYVNKDKLDTTLKQFDELMATIDMGGAFKKARLIITQDNRGIFSFGLASKGLYNPTEYFSAELAIDSPNEFPDNPSGIVPTKFVKEITILTKKEFFYDSNITNKKYVLTPQKEGTQEINLGTRSNYVFATSNKKSYMMFEKKGGKAKMVELFIPVHKQVGLDNIVAILLATKFFQFYGIKTRVNAIRIYYEGPEYIIWNVPIKDYGDELDIEALCAKSVDGRWWSAVETSVSTINPLNQYNIGNPTRATRWGGQGASAGNVMDYINIFSRYKNWYINEIKEGREESLRIDKKLMLIGGNYSGSGLNATMAEFYRIIDTVDLQFNKVEDSCKRIYKRVVEDRLQEYFTTQQQKGVVFSKISSEMDTLKPTYKKEFKIYVQQLLGDAFWYPTNGVYVEPIEEREKIDDEYDKKIEQLNNFLTTI